MFSLFLSDARAIDIKVESVYFLILYFVKSYAADHFVLTAGLNTSELGLEVLQLRTVVSQLQTEL